MHAHIFTKVQSGTWNGSHDHKIHSMIRPNACSHLPVNAQFFF